MNIRRRAALVSLAVVVTSSLVVGGQVDSASAAQRTRITSLSVKSPIKGETFSVRGTTSTHVVRKVTLQRKTKHAWKSVTSVRTSKAGVFSIPTKLTSSRTFRVYVPKKRVGHHTYKKQVTRTRTVKPVTQTARIITALQYHVGQTLAIEMLLTPARQGRPVTLTAYRLDKTTDDPSVIQSVENSQGRAVFTRDEPINVDQVGQTFKLVLTSPAWNGAPAVTSKPVTITVVQ